MLNLKSSAYQIRNGGEGQYEFFSDISTRNLLSVRIGEGAGKISSGSGNAFVGFEAGKENKQGSFGVFVGFQAGSINERGNYCTYVGSYAGRENRRGNENTFVGFRAGELNKDGSECVAIGAYAMRENYSGNRSVAVGYRAAERTLDADFNTMIGAEAGQDNRSGNFNTMAGYRAGRALFRGNENTYFGAFAGYSNSLGDGNCYIGYRAGYDTSGSNNVSVGYNVSSQLSGDENVIIGANTLLKYNTSGTVGVGYNIGNIFEYGNCNVFIGYGVDSHESVNSFGIAIGSLDVKTYNNSVVIGNTLDCSGISSILIGKNINSYSPNSISIGNDISLSSVYVLNDTLSYNYDVTASRTYDLFDLEVSYTDTIYDGINSNTSAVFSKVTSNVFNSGTNKLTGNINQYDYNIVNLFYSHLLYQGQVYQIYNDDIISFSNINTPLSNELNIQTRNYNYDLTTELESITSNDQYAYNRITIPISLSNIIYEIDPSLYDTKTGIVGLNLVRMDDLPYANSNTFDYYVYFPKSYTSSSISNIDDISSINIESSYDIIKNTTAISWDNYTTWEYELVNSNNTDANYPIITSNIILRQPQYGLVDTNLYGSDFTFNYNLYPEALFAEKDEFVVATGRDLDNIVSISTPNTFTINMSNVEIFNSSNYYSLHPTNGLYLSRASILRKPLYSSAENVSIDLSSNIKLIKSGTTYTYNDNPVSMTYDDIINKAAYLLPENSNTQFNDIVNITIDDNTYPFDLSYSYSNYSGNNTTSNIQVTIPTDKYLNAVNIITTDENTSNVYISKYPTYGTITIPDNLSSGVISYQPYHPYQEDYTEIVIRNKNYTEEQYTYKTYNINLVRDSNEYYLIDVYKRHETPINYNASIITSPADDTRYDFYDIRNNELLFSIPDGGSYTNTINVSIPTIQLKEHFIYQKEGYYELNSNLNDSTDKFIHKGVGLVSSWYQSNIANGEIYYWMSDTLDSGTLYDLRSIYFFEDKVWNIKYYNNVYNNSLPHGTNQEFRFNTSNYVSQLIKRIKSPSETYTNFIDENDTIIGIQSLTDSIIIREDTNEIVNHINYYIIEDTKYYYVPLSKELTENIEIFYISTDSEKYNGVNDTTTILSKQIQLNQRIINPIYNNTGITNRIANVTSNQVYFFDTAIPTSNILYRITTNSDHINKVEFIQEEINNDEVYIFETNNLTSIDIEYDILNSNDYSSLTSGVINVINYRNSIFPSVVDSINSSNTIIQIQNSYEHKQDGYLWDYFENAFTFNPFLNSNLLNINILDGPNNGYLYSLNQDSNVITQINYTDFKNDTIYYIPYTPLELSNDSYRVFFEYKNDISDTYDIILKNYWCKFAPILTNSNANNPRVINRDYQFSIDDISISDGFIQDNYSLVNNNGIISITGLSNYEVSYTIENKQFTERPYFKEDTISKSIDISGFLYLNDLIDTDNIIVSSNSRDLHYFVSSNPSYGCIVKYSDSNHFIADPYFTYTDIVTNNVFYKHYGEYTSNDNFSIIVGSLKSEINDNILDVNRNSSITYTINVYDKPNIILLDEGYVYKQTSNEIVNDYNIVSSNVINIESGYINVYDKRYVNIYTSDDGEVFTNTDTFSIEQLHNNQVYYRITSGIFQGGSNVNEHIIMYFLTSSQSNIYITDPYSDLLYYSDLYLNNWNINLNQYNSENTIITELSTSNQTVKYYQKRTAADYISFDNREIQVEFTIYPEQQVLYDPELANGFDHVNYLKEINTFTFDFNIIDQYEDNILKAIVTESDVTITNYNSNEIIVPINIPFNTSSIISFKIFDNNNNDYLSMYINEINYLTEYDYSLNIPAGKELRTIELQSDIESPENFYNIQVTSNISDEVYLYYDLTNFANKLKFNNLNIYVNASELDTDISTSSIVHNIIVGKTLDVRGLDNICVGKNFKTSGSESIILGNNIGVNKGAQASISDFNEIFQSIVIANESFINTRVRNVIAIGNNIFDSDTQTTAEFTEFLEKRPVIIGNDITTEYIDFHINFQNTVLKTTYDEYTNGGIYLGIDNEIVAIGYTSNERFTNDYQLYVNGGIMYSGDISIGKKTFGNIQYTSGTSHSLQILISWDNIQTDDYSAFDVNGKFRGIVSDASYVYRRFESLVTAKNDSGTSKPKSLTDFEVSSYSTADITGYTHTITRNTSSSVILTLSWTTTSTLTSVNKMVAHLEVEVSYPNSLGIIKMSKI